MSRQQILIVLGLLTALAPFSGLPASWLQWVLPIMGAMISFIGFAFSKRKVRPAQNEAVAA